MRFLIYTIAGGFLFMLKLHLSLFSLLVKQIHRKEMHSYETTKARILYWFLLCTRQTLRHVVTTSCFYYSSCLITDEAYMTVSSQYGHGEVKTGFLMESVNAVVFNY